MAPKEIDAATERLFNNVQSFDESLVRTLCPAVEQGDVDAAHEMKIACMPLLIILIKAAIHRKPELQELKAELLADGYIAIDKAVDSVAKKGESIKDPKAFISKHLNYSIYKNRNQKASREHSLEHSVAEGYLPYEEKSRRRRKRKIQNSDGTITCCECNKTTRDHYGPLCTECYEKDFARSRRKRVSSKTAKKQIEDALCVTETGFDVVERDDEVEAILNRCPAEERAVAAAFFALDDNYSDQAIADYTGTHRKTVNRIRHRIIEREQETRQAKGELSITT